MGKTYRTTLRLGAVSDTDDADGTITATSDRVAPDRQAIEKALAEFMGAQEQVPPAFSAAKVAGRRAHELARRGQEVQLQSRTVHIHGIGLLAYDYPRLELEIRCGKGTYIRSLARDLGQRLGCGALVQTLRRTEVGPFRADGALTLEADRATAQAALLPLGAAVSELPRINVTCQEAVLLRRGMVIPWKEDGAEDTAIAVFDELEKLVAIVQRDAQQNVLRPEKVIVI
jgi:tRNA pseudouridine55 synthase